MSVRKHAYVMSEIINEKGYKIIGEVGIWKGRFLTGTLWSCPQITEYWGVDRWTTLDNPDYKEKNMLEQDQEGWDVAYFHVCRMMLKHKQLKLIKAESLEAVKLFPKGYFDFVFIDADHAYEYVLADIKAWLPLVRKGGIISGHDHIKRTPGVKQAVAECFGTPNVDFQTLPARCWMKEIE